MAQQQQRLYTKEIYAPPKWMVDHLPSHIIPSTRIRLATLPTPIHQFSIPVFADLGVDLWIKRDDLTSNDLSGNKVRKLEFLLADAVEKRHDCVITIGGEQSNHCRATAAAARQLGLQPYLILRTKTPANELTLTGNLLIDRMVGSHIRTVTPRNYFEIGSNELISRLAHELRAEGKNPYAIPVGGSNAQGTFGYLQAADEIRSSYCQCNEISCQCECPYQHIVFASGSGGTAAGLAIGLRLAGVHAKVHTVGVCDSPEEFYHIITELATGLGLDATSKESLLADPQSWIHIHQGKGNGYAMSTPEELDFLYHISSTTGIILDPVYSGKGLYYFYQYLRATPEVINPNDRILFVHTGGLYGLYAQEDQLLPLMPSTEYVKALPI